MEYELIDWKLNGNLKDNGDDTSSQAIIVKVGIVGDTYGFVAPDSQKNMTTIIVPNKSFNIDQLKAFITQEALSFVANTYPNT